MTNACFFDCLSADTIKVRSFNFSFNHRQNIYLFFQIAGDANKAQIMTALETYVSRDYFCSRSMYLLFGILQQNDDESILNDEERIFCVEVRFRFFSFLLLQNLFLRFSKCYAD